MKKKIIVCFVGVVAILGIFLMWHQQSVSPLNLAWFEDSRQCREQYAGNPDKISVEDAEREFVASSEDKVFLSVYEPHFTIKGVPYLVENEYELSRDFNLGGVNPDGVEKRIGMTSGIRICFMTDAESITVRVCYGYAETPEWFCKTGSTGIDVYEDMTYCGTIYLSEQKDRTVEKEIDLSGGMSQIVIYLPTYAEVQYMDIGFQKGTTIGCTDDMGGFPIVFYGSSITQGCSASRPALTFPAIVSRKLDTDFINLGFSGSCKGEKDVAEAIAKLDMSAVVIEYDHNADTAEDLGEHYPELYHAIRERHPDIPVVLLSRISGGISCTQEEAEDRDRVIKSVYDRALSQSDENIYFIDGCTLSDMEDRDLYLADDRHPNDLGMNTIANAVIDVLRE